MVSSFSQAMGSISCYTTEGIKHTSKRPVRLHAIAWGKTLPLQGLRNLDTADICKLGADILIDVKAPNTVWCFDNIVQGRKN